MRVFIITFWVLFFWVTLITDAKWPVPTFPLEPNTLGAAGIKTTDIPIYVDVKEPYVREEIASALRFYENELEGFRWHYTSDNLQAVVISDEDKYPETAEYLHKLIDNKDTNTTWLGYADSSNNRILINKNKTLTYKWRHVVIHELGHLFGLSHSEDPDSTMYFKTINGKFQYFTPADLKNLGKIHLLRKSVFPLLHSNEVYWPEHAVLSEHKMPAIYEYLSYQRSNAIIFH